MVHNLAYIHCDAGRPHHPGTASQSSKLWTRNTRNNTVSKQTKVATWTLFQNVVKQTANEVIVATLFCDELEEMIKDAINRELALRVVDETFIDLSFSKRELLIKVMEDLADKGDFSSFMSYIDDARTYTRKWIIDYANGNLSSALVNELTAQILEDIISSIARSVRHASEEATTDLREGIAMDQWVHRFCRAQELEQFPFPVRSATLQQTAAATVVNIKHLQALILERLHDVKKRLSEHFEQLDASSLSQAEESYRQMADKLWGCLEQCPFCAEPCLNTTANHYPTVHHTCIQHRPRGLSGLCSPFPLEACNYEVQSNACYRCSASNYACRKHGKCKTTGDDWVEHSYRRYKEYFPEWDIPPSRANDLSKYWKWFVAMYQTQLSGEYGVKLDVPNSWKNISKETALKSLREY